MTLGSRCLGMLLATQVLLCVSIVLAQAFLDCGACSRGPELPAILGLVGYTVLAIRHRIAGLSADVFSGILFGAGIHAALAAQMFLRGNLCGLCLAAAALSFTMAGISILVDRANVGRFAMMAPGAALLVMTGWSPAPTPRPQGSEAGVLIQIYTQADCPYCESLRDEVMPDIEKEFGRRVKTEYRPADELPGVRRTPTLILHPREGRSPVRIIEGLPTLERLRGVIRDLETGT